MPDPKGLAISMAQLTGHELYDRGEWDKWDTIEKFIRRVSSFKIFDECLRVLLCTQELIFSLARSIATSKSFNSFSS